MDSGRVELWSCGGGRQSAGMAALIAEGSLPRPDHVAMVEIEWERETVWPYVRDYIFPAMLAIGIPCTAVPRKKYAKKGFFGGADGRSVLLPVFSNQSGKKSKLPEWCSGEWKREVMTRWASEQPGWKRRGVNVWIGISRDESRRRRNPRRQWLQPYYPLLDHRVTTVQGCLAAVERQGWPPPPRSRCFFCPNQSDREWGELSPAEFKLACNIEDRIREVDPCAYFHRSLTPLRLVSLDITEAKGDLFSGGCKSGMCY